MKEGLKLWELGEMDFIILKCGKEIQLPFSNTFEDFNNTFIIIKKDNQIQYLLNNNEIAMIGYKEGEN